MVQVTLVCGIVGVRESVFSVGIDTTDWVDQLKDAIKAAKPAMIQSDARDLQLFLARRDGVNDAWMKREEVQQGVLDTKGLRQLKFAAVPLSFNGLSERDVQTETTEAGQNSPVHVLVVLPPTLTKRQSVPLNVRGVIIHVTESMVLNDPPLVAYWHALATSSTAIVADTVVSLPNGTYILGNPALGSGIYIRSCFQELWLMFSGSVRGIGILGSPGVGKTYFAYSILLYLARRGETVVYESAAIEKCILFSGNVVVQGTREDFDSILMQTGTCYLVDGARPKYCPAKTILLSSSRECIWRTVSDFGRMHRMPVWSEEEILNCRELVYSNTPVTVVEDCYRRWGGIPLYVLRHAEDADQQKLLDEAIENVRLVDLKKMCVETLIDRDDIACGDEKKVLDRLFHDRVDDKFYKKGFAFASVYVDEKVCQKLVAQDGSNFKSFLAGY
uniref:Crinkler effector protein N-terminal domain-containing protein n=1 Tax=Peronospora matthiolae TaxID=2874970 RepID=A0AAV1T256_9STRA